MAWHASNMILIIVIILIITVSLFSTVTIVLPICLFPKVAGRTLELWKGRVGLSLGVARAGREAYKPHFKPS